LCYYTLSFFWEVDLSSVHPTLKALLGGVFGWYFTVFPPLAAALLLCRTYRRNALNWRWPVLGCVLLAFIAGTFYTGIRASIDPNKDFIVYFSHDLQSSPEWILLTFMPRFALALGIGLLLIQRAQRQMAATAADVARI
jgi:hypothetical protein